MERNEQIQRVVAPALVSSFLATAETLGNLGLHGQAAAFCEKALALETSREEITVHHVRHLSGQARVAAERGALIEAELALRRIVSLGSKDAQIKIDLARVLCLRGLALADAGRGILAESAIREACRLVPDLAQAQAALARVHAVNQNFAPRTAVLLEQLKSGNITQDNAVEMELFVRRLQMNRPDLTSQLDPLLARALIHQGGLYFGADSAIDATIALRKAAGVDANVTDEISGSLAAILYNLAVHYFNNGRGVEAEGCLWEALALRPGFAPVQDFLARCGNGMGLALYNIVDPDYAQPARDIMTLLRVADVTGAAFVRKGGNNDGGYVMVDSGLSRTVAYSLGISDDVAWDLSIAELGTEIFQYDYSISALPAKHPLFHWFQLGVAGKPGGDPKFRTLPDLIAQNGHTRRRDMILKTDIEGSEWEMLAEMSQDTLGQFSQIVGEFHGFLRLADSAFYKMVRGVLEKLNVQFQLVHIHANNYGARGCIGGVVIANTYEFTYLRRDGHSFAACSRQFPTHLDRANNPKMADYYLGIM